MNRLVLLGTGIIGLSFALCGCAKERDTLSILETRSDMRVTTGWLQSHLNDPELTVLHVSSRRSGYESGHIPGAIFVSWSDLAVTREGVPDELPTLSALFALLQKLHVNEKTNVPGMSTGVADAYIGIVGGHSVKEGLRTVIYDEGDGAMAAQAYVALDFMGLGERASLLDGHLPKWTHEGKALSTEDVVPQPSDFTPRLRPGMLLTMLEVKEFVDSKRDAPQLNVAIVDARREAEYAGRTAGKGVSRPGHIPGAVNVPWRSTLAEGDVSVLQPVSALHSLYGNAGLEPGDLVIVYGRTGAEAAHSYYTLRYLGFDARLYEGSYIEWSSSEQEIAHAAGK